MELEDLAGFDEVLAENLKRQPTEHLQLFEEAAKEVADEITAPRPTIEEEVQDVQILINSKANATNIRDLKVYFSSCFLNVNLLRNCIRLQSDSVSRLVKIAGIIISASGIKAKATKISIQCRTCGNVIPNLPINSGFEGYAMPRKCNT